jgi:hypothetical protein
VNNDSQKRTGSGRRELTELEKLNL